jgi:hypothetical protein
MSSASRNCGPCVRESDNKNFDCPPRMADGRLFTDYRSRCDANLQWQQPMSSTYDYRQYLINNGESVMGQMREEAFSKAYRGPCVQPFDQGTVVPEKDAFVCDKLACQKVAGAKDGLGTGRDYGMVPSQQAAVSAFLAEQAKQQARLADGANCCACAGATGYYPLPGLNTTGDQQREARWAVPSGGRPAANGDPSVRCS